MEKILRGGAPADEEIFFTMALPDLLQTMIRNKQVRISWGPDCAIPIGQNDYNSKFILTYQRKIKCINKERYSILSFSKISLLGILKAGIF